MSESLFITGLYGCSCHPFKSWEECRLFSNRVFKIGENIRNRHSGKIGTVYELSETKGYLSVKYGDLRSDIELEHVAMLDYYKQNSLKNG